MRIPRKEMRAQREPLVEGTAELEVTKGAIGFTSRL